MPDCPVCNDTGYVIETFVQPFTFPAGIFWKEVGCPNCNPEDAE